MTYSLLALIFLAAALLIAAWALLRAARLSSRQQPTTTPRESTVSRSRPIAGVLRRWLPAAAITFLIVGVLTAVFDSVLVGADIIRYDGTLISGIRIGLAPIEDFAYPAAATLLVPSLWSLLTPARSLPQGHKLRSPDSADVTR